MIRKFFSPWPFALQGILAFVRIITGLLMIYHGLELFDESIMNKYLSWEIFQKLPAAKFWVYTGKIAELLSGLFLTLGLLTRVGALLLIMVMCFIAFVIGHGKFWYEDQHPFLLILSGLVFLFSGSGRFGLDALLFTKAKPV